MKTMKNTILALLLAAMQASAQTDNCAALLPFGPWPVCEDPAAAAGNPICTAYAPGNEGYILLMHSAAQAALAYRYAVTVTLRDGSVVTRAGVIERTDAPGGVADTSVILFFGGVAASYTITVEDLGVIGLRLNPRR
jgi:hypothetical protein